MELNPKVVGMISGAIAGVGIGAGLLQGIGIDASAVASDVATVVTEGLLGCPAEPTRVCAAGGRLVAVVTLIALGAVCAAVGRVLSPAKAEAAPVASPPPPAA